MPTRPLAVCRLRPWFRGGFAAGIALAALTSATAQVAPPLPVAPASPAAPATPLPPTAQPATPFRDDASGVGVYTTLDDQIFPALWRTPTIAAAADPLPAATDTARLVRLMRVALSKYPPDLLRGNLERVYLVGDLRFQGIHAAGTNSANRIFIKVEPANRLYTDAFIEESFHHEFAHILRRNYDEQWDETAWTKANPADFHYGAPSGVEAVQSGHASLWYSETWARRGFLSEYAASDISEDFATIGGGLFTGDPVFWKWVERFPLLKAKVQVALAFYTRIDSNLTELYFRALRPGVLAVPPAAPTVPVVTPPSIIAVPQKQAMALQTLSGLPK